MTIADRKNWAYIAPFFCFMAIALIFQFAEGLGLKLDNISQPWYRRHPEYLMMIIQMVVCFPLLIYWRKQYEWNVNKGWILGVVGGVVGIAIWILPTHVYTILELGSSDIEDPFWFKYLGLTDRREGFDAAIFRDDNFLYYTAIFLRFIRAVLLVALVEEIFWRGFLMRFIRKPDGKYWDIPFGMFHFIPYVVVTLCFMSVHSSVDWLAAFLFGSIMYALAVKTKSLFACILMHSVANLLMGVYVLTHLKYGLW